ncbi:MAG: MFS transporter, partial [Acidimicrobiales bacterium]
LGPRVLASLPTGARAAIVGRRFFPGIIQRAFVTGLHPALDFAAAICAIAAVTSWLRGSSRPSTSAVPGAEALVVE